MENTIQDQLAHQQEMLRDLQAQLADATDEEKKKSLRLKMNVTNAKIAELQSKQSSEPVNEETPEEVEELEIETPEEQLDETSYEEDDMLNESVYEVSKDDIRWDDKIVLKTAKFYGIAVAPDYDHTNHFLFAGNQKDLYRFITEILRHSPVRGQNFKVLKESLPSNYSKSKYLKEVSEATKAIRDICTRIDNSAKRGDLYNIAGDFGAISAFAKRCEEGSKEIYGYEKKGTLTESVESKKDFLKHLDNYEKDIKKAIDSIRKNIKDSKKTSGMDGDYLVSISSAISNALTRYNHSVDTKTLTESIVQDKARWDDAVKFGKSHGHPAPKLKLGQKTSKGEVVGVMYGRLSSTPIYSVSKDGGKTFKDYYEEELMEGCMTKKFENMTNRELASYIFSHPHTKFAGKMKECDDKEIMKAIRAMKKTEEEAPVTNTSAVATAEAPSMFMKKKLK